MGDINLVVLAGRLTKDADVRHTQGGQCVANFSVATERRYKDGDEWKGVTTFHNVVWWSKQAETIRDRLVKGAQVTVNGSLETRTYEKDGQKRYITEVRADNVIVAGGAPRQEQQKQRGFAGNQDDKLPF